MFIHNVAHLCSPAEVSLGPSHKPKAEPGVPAACCLFWLILTPGHFRESGGGGGKVRETTMRRTDGLPPTHTPTRARNRTYDPGTCPGPEIGPTTWVHRLIPDLGAHWPGREPQVCHSAGLGHTPNVGELAGPGTGNLGPLPTFIRKSSEIHHCRQNNEHPLPKHCLPPLLFE